MLAIAVVSAMVIPVAAQTQSPAGIDALITQVVQLSNQGKYAEAAPIAQQALTLAEQTLGRDHPRTLSSVNNLAYLYQAQGRYKEAEPLYQRALERASES